VIFVWNKKKLWFSIHPE